MRELDLNADGKISLEEYTSYYLKNCIVAQEPSGKKLIRHLDEQITTDLVQISMCNDRDRLKTLCKRVFEHIDADESGEIEPKEVKQFLQGRYQIEFEKNIQMFNYLDGIQKAVVLASVHK